MTGTEWLVVLGGLAAVAWVNWYFFVAGQPGARLNDPKAGSKRNHDHDITPR